MACLREAALCRYFKQRTEQTFSQFINQVRITHATQLLVSEDLSMSDVCYQCGFLNVSYFNRQFKEIIGQSPLAYQKALLHPSEIMIS